jgi:hypothetical protein
MHSFDIMADLTFGESMGLLEAQEYSPWLQGIFDGIFYACVSRAFQYFPTLWKVVQLFIPRSVHEAAEASVKHSADRVDKRLAMDTERPDIFGLVLKHETGSKMPRREMHANADLLMIAGTETTATMLSGLTYNLLTNPGPMEKLTREVRGSFESADEITIDALPKLPVGHPHATTPRTLLTNPVPVRLPRRGSSNIPVRWGRRAPQDKRHRCNHLRTLRPAKRKQHRSCVPSATRTDTAAATGRRQRPSLRRLPLVVQFHRRRQLHPRTLARRRLSRFRPTLRRRQKESPPALLYRPEKLPGNEVSRT